MQVTFLRSRKTLRNIVDRMLKDHHEALTLSQNSKENGHGQENLPQNTASVSQSNGVHHHQNGHSVTNGHSNIYIGDVNDKSSPVPVIRKGVKPGSFIDLLVRGSMRGTGEQFTDNQKAQQVCHCLYSRALE